MTPVHNGGKYLVECIESVLAQTYADWHFTIVDNASDDETPDIASRYAARDSRIRHLRFEEFVDATASYNRAFAAVIDESEFCKVVGADDWLYPECLERMVAAAGGSDSVAVVSAYQLWGQERVHLLGLPYSTTFVPGRDIVRGTLLGDFNVTGGPTALLLRSAYVRERVPFYEGDLFHPDTDAALWLLSRYDFAFVHQVLTFRREEPGARITRAYAINSHLPEDILFLLRYGGAVLSEPEYRTRLHELLRAYVRWHGRQLPRPSRLRDEHFFAFHQAKRKQLLAGSEGRRDVKLAMTIVGAMLQRGAVHSLRYRPRAADVQ